ncbi:MAG: TIGR02757 family protein [Prolixibacteraceae bacterium]|jgi:uncharacterized protein (TIGR02757 family)|nr:TIGR02757 family protein [Prolixibacteraceae bacterium]
MSHINTDELKTYLDQKYNEYNVPSFIENDPVSIPHQFDKKEDIEIAGFLAATIAWGNRKSIINNANKLMKWMGYFPHEFILNASEKELIIFNQFVHRTMNGIDTVYFLKALKNIYVNHAGLETVFTKGYQREESLFSSIEYFRKVFLELPHEHRTEKHVANVTKKSSGKRLCMYLRWMVRNDKRGVDFGLWKDIPTSSLMLPLDVHTGNVSRKLGLLKRKQNDWLAVEEVTESLRKLNSNDPVKYDFSLFGIGVNKEL